MYSSATTAALQRLMARWCRQVDVVLRRGSTTLAAQSMALALPTSRGAREGRSAGAAGAQADVVLWGAPTLNIAVGDRFTWDGVACEVVLVRPGRTLATVAEAVLIR
jgi:hypothetical protein